MTKAQRKVVREKKRRFTSVSTNRMDEGVAVSSLLVLDIAGGHGTKEAIVQFKAIMKNDYNIIPVHQIPQSPETNVLDLGIWMSLQSAVEKCHRLRRGDNDALRATIMKVWKDVASEEAFVKVFERLKKNYAVIEKSQGSNDYCEEFRGKKVMEDIAAYDFVGADM